MTMANGQRIGGTGGGGIMGARILAIASAAAVMTACVLALMSCAGDEEDPVAIYSEPCSATIPCAQGLSCLNGLCTQTCVGMDHASCRANLSPSSICQSGACFEPCDPGSPCDNGLVCTMAGTTIGTCRP